MNSRLMDLFILIKQLFRFGVVGVIAAVTHFSMVVLLVQSFQMPPLIANIFGFILGFQVSYWGHRIWTFAALEVLHREAIPRLLFIQLINFAANETFFYLLLQYHFSYYVALLIVLSILPIFTFISSKFWVFKTL